MDLWYIPSVHVLFYSYGALVSFICLFESHNHVSHTRLCYENSMQYKQTIIVISNKVVISIRNHSWCSKIKMQRNQYVANRYINKACGLSIAKKPKTLWYQISLALKMTVKSTITSSLLPFHCEWLLFYNFRYWNTCNKFDNRCKTIQQNISKGLNKKKLQTQSYFNLHFCK